MVCGGGGLRLTAAVTVANVADVTMLAAMVDDLPPVRTPSGRRSRPSKVHADRGMTARPIVRGCGGTVAVVAELLAAAAGAVGPGLWAVVRVGAAGLCGGLLQAAVIPNRRHERGPPCQPSRAIAAEGPTDLVASSAGGARVR
jgi:hypothetical protein